MSTTTSAATVADLPSRLAASPNVVAQRLMRKRQPLPAAVEEAVRRLYSSEGTEGDVRTMFVFGLRLLAGDDERVSNVADMLSEMPPADREAWLDAASRAWAPFFTKMGLALGRLPDVAAVADDGHLRGCVVEPGCALDLDSYDEVIVAHEVVQTPEREFLAGFTLPAGAVPPPRSDDAATAARTERLADAILKEVR